MGEVKLSKVLTYSKVKGGLADTDEDLPSPPKASPLFFCRCRDFIMVIMCSLRMYKVSKDQQRRGVKCGDKRRGEEGAG